MTDRLDEVVQELEESSQDLEREGLTTLTYWLARCGIDRARYQEWAEQEVSATLSASVFQSELNADQQILGLFSLGFLYGLLLGRRYPADEF